MGTPFENYRNSVRVRMLKGKKRLHQVFIYFTSQLRYRYAFSKIKADEVSGVRHYAALLDLFIPDAGGITGY
ncbi:hypothetical protein [Sodalis ligni]|jgi:hypothetical protein|uniref:hypothetical protein n=1 Tax=Sodalis ligni TaxID=2697027 RepID=UPI00104A10E9|nr:hypothetical protein [Sodalis ligni]